MARTAMEAGASTVALEAVRQIEAVAALDGPAYRARWAEKRREGGAGPSAIPAHASRAATTA